MKLKCFVLILLLSLILSSISVANIGSEDPLTIGLTIDISSRFAGGNGTRENPYQISNVTELQNMSADLNAHYVLINDIDASATKTWNWNGEKYEGFEPIGYDTSLDSGFQGTRFTGSLNGNHYEIKSLYICQNQSYCVGLIGQMYRGGSIENISLDDVDISGYWGVGGLIGVSYGDCCKNCYVNGKVSGITHFVGGLMGQNREGGIMNCTVTISIKGNNTIGGLVGITAMDIINCSSKGSVLGTSGVGGLTGLSSYFQRDSEIRNCSFDGAVYGTSQVGGLVGKNQRTNVRGCSSKGEIYGLGQYIGGLIGYHESREVIGCFSNCNVSGNAHVGGLVGDNSYWIRDSYSLGNVTGNQSVGGLVGTELYSLSYNSYYCINNSLINGKKFVTKYGIYEKHFNDWLGNDNQINIDNYLQINNSRNAYEIGNLYDLKSLLLLQSSQDITCYQTSDIDLSNEPGFYIPLLMGDYEGNNFQISNLNVTEYNNNYLGFFGRFWGDISNLSICDSRVSGLEFIGGLVGQIEGNVLNCSAHGNISSESYQCGGLLGRSRGNVINCHTTGRVHGDYYVGGLAGELYGLVECCYSNANVSSGVKENSGYYTGGFCGISFGDIRNCYSTGNVTGNRYVGGFLGSNRWWESTTYNCYSTGKVNGEMVVGGFMGGDAYSTIENCFFDEQKSQQTRAVGTQTVYGVHGKKTEEMKSRKTFEDHNWNFSTPWRIIEGHSYPFFNNWTPVISNIKVGENRTVYEDDKLNMSIGLEIDSEWPIPGLNITSFNNYTINTTSDWIQYSPDQIALVGTPTNKDVGKNYITINAQTEFGLIEENITITVNNTNDPPFFYADPPDIIYQDSYFSYDFDAIDEDPTNDTFNWSMYTNAPWLRLNSTTGNLSGIPGNDDVGRYHYIITAKDENGAFLSLAFGIEVINTNDPPTMINNSLTAREEMEFHHTIIVTDPDFITTGDNHTFNLTSGPEGLTVNHTTGEIIWTPTNLQAAQTHYVYITCMDSHDGETTQVFEIYVINVNDDPTITSIPVKKAYVGEEYRFKIESFDEDFLNPSNEEHRFDLDLSPKGMKINSTSGVITWTPTEAHTGQVNEVWYTVRDSEGAVASDEFFIYVELRDSMKEKNQPPGMFPTNQLVLNEDESIENLDLNTIIYDPEGDDMKFKGFDSDHIQVQLDNDKLTIIPQPDWHGEESILIVASDQDRLTNCYIPVKVLPVNDIPINNNFSYQIDELTNTVSLRAFTAYDADGDELVYVWNLGDGTTTYGETISHTYDVQIEEMNFNITLTVTDGSEFSKVCRTNITLQSEQDRTEPDDDKEEDSNNNNKANPFIFVILIVIIIFLITFFGIPFLLSRWNKEHDKDPYEENEKNEKRKVGNT